VQSHNQKSTQGEASAICCFAVLICAACVCRGVVEVAREMCRVTMHQVWTHRITTDGLYEGTGIKSIEYYIRMRTLRRVGHVARMDKNTAVASAPYGMSS
jgi:hypothetical protein